METVEILKGISVLCDKHELSLNGPECTDAFRELGFYDGIFKLKNLNFLSISVDLKEFPPRFATLSNLTSLVLHSNKLRSLPVELGSFPKLKLLDISRNCFDVFPDVVCDMVQLSSLNLSNNNLKVIPSLRRNVKLTCLNISCNKLEFFPECCYSELSLLSEILLNSNQIAVISNDIKKLQGLKVLDMGDNKIKEIPPELGDLPKLRDLNLKGNKLSDNRLMKTINQCHNKQIIDYIKQNYGKRVKAGNERKGSQRSSLTEEVDEATASQLPKYLLQIFKPDDKGFEVFLTTTAVKPVRQSIVCCILRNVNFSEESFKKFIQLQNKFHDTICNKRERGTIGTHDTKMIKSPLKYTAVPPTELLIKPLGEESLISATEFVNKKKEEADKKTTRRQMQSGINRFFNLLDGLEHYPCLIDSESVFISFPPITNSEVSRITPSTKNILVEVTSKYEKKVCKEIMDKFIKDTLLLDIGSVSDTMSSLEIEQVLVVQEKGPKYHYPSDNDLKSLGKTVKKMNMF